MILERLNLPDLLEDEINALEELKKKRAEGVPRKRQESGVITSKATSKRQNVTVNIRYIKRDDTQSEDQVISETVNGDDSGAVSDRIINNYKQFSGKTKDTDSRKADKRDSNEIFENSNTEDSNTNDHTPEKVGKMKNKSENQCNDTETNSLMNVGDVSLTDLLDSCQEPEEERDVSSIIGSLRVGSTPGDYCSQSTQENLVISSTKIDRAMELPSKTSTPINKKFNFKTKKKNDTDANVDTLPDKDLLTDKKSNEQKQSVIHKTIENRIIFSTQRQQTEKRVDTRKEKKVKKDRKEGYSSDDELSPIVKSSRARLVCIKDKKSTNIGEGPSSSGMPASRRKGIENVLKKKPADDLKNTLEEHKPDKSNEGRKKKRSSSSDNDKHLSNKTSAPEKENTAVTLNRDTDKSKSAAKSNISSTTLTKLKKFQFDESKSRIFSGSDSSGISDSSISLTDSMISGNLWTNENDTGSGVSQKSLHKENEIPLLSNKTENGTKESANNKKETDGDKLRKFGFKRKIDTVEKVIELKSENENVINTKTDLSAQVVSSQTFTESTGQLESSKSEKKGPSWLATLKAKFSSPVLNFSVSKATEKKSSAYNGSHGNDVDDDLDDIDFDGSDFLSTLNKSKRQKTN